MFIGTLACVGTPACGRPVRRRKGRLSRPDGRLALYSRQYSPRLQPITSPYRSLYFAPKIRAQPRFRPGRFCRGHFLCSQPCSSQYGTPHGGEACSAEPPIVSASSSECRSLDQNRQTPRSCGSDEPCRPIGPHSPPGSRGAGRELDLSHVIG